MQKISLSYYINRKINEEEITKFLEQINYFIHYTTSIYIFDNANNINVLKQIENVKHIKWINYLSDNEAMFAKQALDYGIQNNDDFGVLMQLGYYYEESGFEKLVNYLNTNDTSKLAILTPFPLLTCEYFEQKEKDFRLIKGCKFIGAFINLSIYKKSKGINLDYYRTTYDFEYCIDARLNGDKIVLSQNVVLRNNNYVIISKSIFGQNITSYEKDYDELYYETRNRHYLWKKYEHLDKEYIYIDKKIYKAEKKEIRLCDPNYKIKFKIIKKAIKDYKNNILGKYSK